MKALGIQVKYNGMIQYGIWHFKKILRTESDLLLCQS